jgi:hypothetical protein
VVWATGWTEVQKIYIGHKMLFIPVDGTHLVKPWVAVGLWCLILDGRDCLVGLDVAVRCGVAVSVASS